ncbi:3-methyladenine DNA glycosylase AlkD [Parelusimicrobium proximum]|uniref:DNA alkylation repair protein n=1 Tax=Parelusimicrobium proximum TaxID=3228953 RepID=UPI003D16A72F
MKIKEQIEKEFNKHADKKKAADMQRFFKTGKGEYAEGDIFLGLSTAVVRGAANKYYKDIPLSELEALLQSPVHDHRSCALAMLRKKYERKNAPDKKEIADLYLRNTEHINNWDLVDISAPHITGPYFYGGDKKILWKLAKSGNLWEERIAIMSTMYNIQQKDFALTLELAEYFLTHKHDLIHKASGWMLREAGKRDESVLLAFLDKHSKVMPRTMLRYAIEKLTPAQRAHYMKK